MVNIILIMNDLKKYAEIYHFLDDDKKISIKSASTDLQQGLYLLKRHEPHMVILDAEGYGIDEKIIVIYLAKHFPKAKIIFLSSNTTVKRINAILELGASAYISKASPLHEIKHAVKAIRARKKYIDSTVAMSDLVMERGENKHAVNQ